jgi:hypothetical protein
MLTAVTVENEADARATASSAGGPPDSSRIKPCRQAGRARGFRRLPRSSWRRCRPSESRCRHPPRRLLLRDTMPLVAEQDHGAPPRGLEPRQRDRAFRDLDLDDLQSVRALLLDPALLARPHPVNARVAARPERVAVCERLAVSARCPGLRCTHRPRRTSARASRGWPGRRPTEAPRRDDPSSCAAAAGGRDEYRAAGTRRRSTRPGVRPFFAHAGKVLAVGLSCSPTSDLVERRGNAPPPVAGRVTSSRAGQVSPRRTACWTAKSICSLQPTARS